MADPSRRRRGRGLFGALALVCACAHEPTDRLAPRVDAAGLGAAVADLPGECREGVRAMFLRGERTAACVAERRAVALRLRPPRTRGFGVVDQHRVDLRGISLVVVEARACRAWPLRAPGYAVLTRPEASAAGCQLRRYSGPVELTAIEADGTSYPGIVELSAEGGIVRLSFAEADSVLRAHGFAGLSAFTHLEMGERAWAGRIDLERLRGFLSGWHFVWVVRGRGSPGLFAAVHSGHQRASDARALAVEAGLARQERDYLAVARGSLGAAEFLRRYVWSPYRRSVAAMAGGPPVPEPEVLLRPTDSASAGAGEPDPVP